MQGVARLQGEGPSGPSPFSFPLGARRGRGAPAGLPARPPAAVAGRPPPGGAGPGEGVGPPFLLSVHHFYLRCALRFP